jgi:hypothetical protein
MPGALPFSRVAVLDPARTFARPDQPSFDRQMRGELQDWLVNARRNSPDVCYPRIHNMLPSAATDLLHFLVGEIDLLAPAAFFPLPTLPLAYHHRAAESDLLPPGPYLQGISCHGLADLQSAELAGYDYAFLSPVFSTATHPDAQALGLASLREAVAKVQLPVIALGGVTLDNAHQCLQAGAAGWAAIRSFLQ